LRYTISIPENKGGFACHTYQSKARHYLWIKKIRIEKITKIASDVYNIPEEKYMIHLLEFSKENTASGEILLSGKKQLGSLLQSEFTKIMRGSL
jgi:hypothetical protein|tara:strand:- start:46445 stop:46726 length:282 start_codon:yes stop_codon:yes gene_type:complete